jgi:hypothetical protein
MTRLAIPLLLAAFALASCDSKEERAYSKTRNAAEKTTQAAMGGKTELRWVVHNQVKGEDIVCAYAAQAPDQVPPGQRPTVVPVIVRAGKTIRAADIGDEAFAKMQDDLCGPDWVKARP